MAIIPGDQIESADFKDTSAGAADSGKGVKLDPNGVLDDSFFAKVKVPSTAASSPPSSSGGGAVADGTTWVVTDAITVVAFEQNGHIEFNKTTNGFTSWANANSVRVKTTAVGPESDRWIYSPDGTTIWVLTKVGSDLVIFKSTDGGAVWDAGVTVIAGVSTGCLIGTDVNNLRVIYNTGTSLRTKTSTDGGAIWSSATTINSWTGSPSPNYISGHAQQDDANIINVVYNRETDEKLFYVRSTDAGVGWGTPINIDSKTLNQHSSVWGNATAIYALYTGSAKALYRSSDAGVTWSVVLDSGTAKITTFLSNSSVYAPSEKHIACFGNAVLTYSVAGSDVAFFFSQDAGVTWGAFILSVNTSSGRVSIHGNGTTQMFLLFQSSASLNIVGVFQKSMVEVEPHLKIQGDTPSYNPTDGGLFYVKSGEIFGRDSEGNDAAVT